MENIGVRVRHLREHKGLTQGDLANLLDMKTYTTIAKWEAGTNSPKGKDLKRLAEIFNVTTDYLLGLPTNVERVAVARPIPVLGAIACGEPLLAEENILEYREEFEDRLPSGELFYLRANGDSMEPTIPNGSYVLIRHQLSVEDGEIAAVLVNGDEEATLKRVKRQGDMIMLIPDNSKYPPFIVNKDNPARIIGKAVKISIDL